MMDRWEPVPGLDVETLARETLKAVVAAYVEYDPTEAEAIILAALRAARMCNDGLIARLKALEYGTHSRRIIDHDALYPAGYVHGLITEVIAALTAQGETAPLPARRYERLRVLGAAPYGAPQLAAGTVLRFQGLDAFVDADLKAHPSRGEAQGETAPLAKLAEQQQDLPPDFAKVLHENRWQLYEGEIAPAPVDEPLQRIVEILGNLDAEFGDRIDAAYEVAIAAIDARSAAVSPVPVAEAPRNFFSYESDKREALQRHIAAIDGRRPQDGHSDRGFSTCPHPACVRANAPVAAEGLTHDDACLLSRAFHAGQRSTPIDQYTRINSYLKVLIAAAGTVPVAAVYGRKDLMIARLRNQLEGKLADTMDPDGAINMVAEFEAAIIAQQADSTRRLEQAVTQMARENRSLEKRIVNLQAAIVAQEETCPFCQLPRAQCVDAQAHVTPRTAQANPAPAPVDDKCADCKQVGGVCASCSEAAIAAASPVPAAEGQKRSLFDVDLETYEREQDARRNASVGAEPEVVIDTRQPARGFTELYENPEWRARYDAELATLQTFKPAATPVAAEGLDIETLTTVTAERVRKLLLYHDESGNESTESIILAALWAVAEAKR